MKIIIQSTIHRDGTRYYGLGAAVTLKDQTSMICIIEVT